MKITIEVEGFKYSVEMPNGTTFNDFMVCNTHGKDMGSIFEAGNFKALEKPIVNFGSVLFCPVASGQFCRAIIGYGQIRALALYPLCLNHHLHNVIT
jgi:hypothetical protein